jgi:uncharacterized protein (TIGR02996 family)
VTEAEAIDAVVANPDDDGPRLVYADWLLERGDPRGELIQLQCRRRRRAPDRNAMQRERELLKAHRREWLGPLHEFVKGKAELVRGFLDELELGGSAKLLELRLDPRLRTVRSLGFVGSPPAVQEGIVTGPSPGLLRRLTQIDGRIIPALAVHDPPLVVDEILRCHIYGGDPLSVIATGRGLPLLRRAVFIADHLPPVAFVPLLSSPKPLETIVVHVAGWVLTLQRAGDPVLDAREVAAGARGDRMQGLAGLLRSIPAGTVTSLALHHSRMTFAPADLDLVRQSLSGTIELVLDPDYDDW